MFRPLTLLLFAAAACLFDTTASAQTLSLPSGIRQAFSKGTRSADGRPGRNYWQNYARYDITLTAAPPSRTITGSEQITYINNSPNSLSSLLFKLTVNIHKQAAHGSGGTSSDYFTSGIHIDSFLVNGQPWPWNDNPDILTLASIPLPKALAAHDSVRLSIRWHYDVSRQSNREGMIDSTSYYLAYFYPRVAVYDDYNGWDDTEFKEILEFYNDFSDYKLHVRVPANYIVWATGTFLNPGSVLQPTYAAKYRQSLASDETISIITPADRARGGITAPNAFNTWEFSAQNVPDVALGLSDHYNWDAASITVDKSTGRRVSAQAAYNDTAADFHHVVDYARQSLRFLSNQWPGIPYPYEKTSVFQGFADMEYPMMVNDEAFADTVFARFVTFHEIAHTYMPFYMGINETRYGFMDEGWATTFELLFNRSVMDTAAADDFYKQFRIAGWAHERSPDRDMPIVTPGPELRAAGIGDNEYGKPSLGYLAVKDLLGDDLFRKCLHEYMSRWHGHHPIPWDFFNSFNSAAGKNLNWFWNNWFFSNNYIDLSVKTVSRTAAGYTLLLANTGGMAAPFNIVLTYTDGGTETIHQSPAVWQTNSKKALINLNTKKTIKSLRIDGGIFMDANENDNTWMAKP